MTDNKSKFNGAEAVTDPVLALISGHEKDVLIKALFCIKVNLQPHVDFDKLMGIMGQTNIRSAQNAVRNSMKKLVPGYLDLPKESGAATKSPVKKSNIQGSDEDVNTNDGAADKIEVPASRGSKGPEDQQESTQAITPDDGTKAEVGMSVTPGGALNKRANSVSENDLTPSKRVKTDGTDADDAMLPSSKKKRDPEEVAAQKAAKALGKTAKDKAKADKIAAKEAEKAAKDQEKAEKAEKKDAAKAAKKEADKNEKTEKAAAKAAEKAVAKAKEKEEKAAAKATKTAQNLVDAKAPLVQAGSSADAESRIIVSFTPVNKEEHPFEA